MPQSEPLGMTPEREKLLRPYSGNYFGKDEMWAEIDALRAQLAAQSEEIEGLKKQKDVRGEWSREFAKTADQLEAECAAMREALEHLAKLHRVAEMLELGDGEIAPAHRKAFADAAATLASTTAGTDLLARLQAAEKSECDTREAADKIILEMSNERVVLERDMRTLVVALNTVANVGCDLVPLYCLPLTNNGVPVWRCQSCVAKSALALPSVQRLMKGE